MSALLLSTKLHVARPPPGLVPRPTLIARLNAGLHPRLTLGSAPAGFGETTLLSQWGTGAEVPVAWVSLDEGENDLIRFLTYLIAVPETLDLGLVGGTGASIGEAALGALQAPQPPAVGALLASLINEIAAVRHLHRAPRCRTGVQRRSVPPVW